MVLRSTVVCFTRMASETWKTTLKREKSNFSIRLPLMSKAFVYKRSSIPFQLRL